MSSLQAVALAMRSTLRGAALGYTCYLSRDAAEKAPAEMHAIIDTFLAVRTLAARPVPRHIHALHFGASAPCQMLMHSMLRCSQSAFVCACCEACDVQSCSVAHKLQSLRLHAQT